MTARAEPPERPAGTVHRGLALLVAGAFFMEILDGTVIAPAAPHIAADFGVPAVAINVAITGYVLTLAVLIPISGWLADRFGARRIFVTAVAIFTLASIGCAVAVNLPMLVSTRVLQGVGGAMMVPVGRLVVLRTTAKSELVKAIAYLTWPALLAPVIAPALGGILSTYASWRWIFVINVPLGVAGLLLARRLVPDVRADDPPGLDWRGFVLTAVGVAALVVGLEDIGAAEPNWTVAGIALVLAAATLAAAVRYLLRTPRPLLDLRILRVPTYRVTRVQRLGLPGRDQRGAVPAAAVLPARVRLDRGPGRPGGDRAVRRQRRHQAGDHPTDAPLRHPHGDAGLGPRLGRPPGRDGLPAGRAPRCRSRSGLLTLSGVFRSVGFTAYNSAAFADVEPERMTGANTLMSTLQELGAGLGVAVGALLVRLGDPVAGASAWAAAPTSRSGWRSCCSR